MELSEIAIQLNAIILLILFVFNPSKSIMRVWVDNQFSPLVTWVDECQKVAAAEGLFVRQ